jgi:hypothetical protein
MSPRSIYRNTDVAARLIGIVALLLALLVVVVAAGTVVLSKSLADKAADHASAIVDARSIARARDRQAETIAACNRGNRLRGYLLIRARELDSKAAHLAPRIFPILDCTASTRLRTDVPIASGEQELYLRILARGRDPRVNAVGRVVGSKPLASVAR